MRTLALLVVLVAASITRAQKPLQVDGLTPGDPLHITATATPTELVVAVKLESEWHLYGRDTGGGQPVELEVTTGSAFAAAGEPEVPMNDKGEITGEAVITLPLRRVGDGGKLDVRFRFMACDPLMCLPPKEVTIFGTVDGTDQLEVLLAVVEMGERSERIAGFLRERGFGCTVVPYGDVTLEECDRHDLVVADSPLFGKHREAYQAALAFPKTGSPIVAIGFLGTVLLESHRIAMACGYI